MVEELVPATPGKCRQLDAVKLQVVTPALDTDTPLADGLKRPEVPVLEVKVILGFVDEPSPNKALLKIPVDPYMLLHRLEPVPRLNVLSVLGTRAK